LWISENNIITNIQVILLSLTTCADADNRRNYSLLAGARSSENIRQTTLDEHNSGNVDL